MLSDQPLTVFERSLVYAHGMVQGGRSLLRLQAGVLDPADLYRAAWTQAVSAFDHWLHMEIYHRAPVVVRSATGPRPPMLKKTALSFDLVDKMQHHDVEIGEAFGEHLRSELGRTSFHAPDAISDGVRYVVDLTPARVWDHAAQNLTTPADPPWTRDTARARHREVLDRRNRIAHEADLDPATGRRHPMTWQEASDAVTWFDDLGHALHTVIAQR